MIKRSVIYSILLCILCVAVSYAADDQEDVPVGKIEFISTSRCEVMVYSESDRALALVFSRCRLFAVADKNRVELTVVKTEGRLIRCTFTCGNTSGSLPGEGTEVFFSRKDNAAAKYADIKVLLSKLINLHENFILKVESTEDPVLLAAAVNELADGLAVCYPELKRLAGKYPELGGSMKSPPDELKGEVELLQTISSRVNDALYKVTTFGKDPEVVKSLQRLDSIVNNNAGK